MVEAPGVALVQQRFQKSARSRVFLVKLLVRGTFDVFIDSSGFLSIAPESAEFVEALWRRRESVPVACSFKGCVCWNPSVRSGRLHGTGLEPATLWLTG